MPTLAEKREKLRTEKRQRKGKVQPPSHLFSRLVEIYKLGQFDQAERLGRTLTSQYPSHPLAFKILGFIYHQTYRFSDAVNAYRQLLKLQPDDAEIQNNLGVILQQQGLLEASVDSFRKAISISKRFVQARYNLGNSYYQMGKLREAESTFQEVIYLDPSNVESYLNLGIIYLESGSLDEAESRLDKANLLDGDRSDVAYNLGLVKWSKGELKEAANWYERAIDLEPSNVNALQNLGALMLGERVYSRAETCFQEAIRHDPTNAIGHINLAILLRSLERFKEAEERCLKAIELNSEHADAFNELGQIYRRLNRLEEAEANLVKALELNSDLASAEAQLLNLRQLMCKFIPTEELLEASERLGIVTGPVSPFASLCWVDNPANQLRRSQRWTDVNYGNRYSFPISAPVTRPSRLKIGYFSADFHDFAGMYLMIGLLENHDRSKYEIYAFSYGPDKDDAMRRRIVSAVDHFVEIRDMPTDDTVQLARDIGIDIAIHRNGHTKLSRTELFQRRLAPIQISYLGFPGTLGARFIDYLVADPIVIPDQYRDCYSENVIYLPHTYQPNDNKRIISESLGTRADHGLLDGSIVLCCFNNSYKIGQKEFDIWMRILGRHPDSVLWLLRPTQGAMRNLRERAESWSIDPARIVFADKVPNPDHLARHRHADLMLDTFYYNAHTTASDALWAGLPIVTKAGKQFSARVAASLLTALGLPELVVESERAYEALIDRLLSDRLMLKEIKMRLQKNRGLQPLFDTERYTRNFENGLKQSYELYYKGQQAQDIWVVED